MKASLILAVCSLIALSSYPALAVKQPLPISDIVKMSESGMSPENVVQRIRATRTTYALRGSHFAELQAAGVSDEVLDYLQQSLVEDVDLLTRYWVAGESLGGCSSCYPQPVNLDVTVSGFGAADTLGRYRPGLPPGVPEWVSSDLSRFRSKSISVSDILEMRSVAIGPGLPEPFFRAV